jgi:hypothetical protein
MIVHGQSDVRVYEGKNLCGVWHKLFVGCVDCDYLTDILNKIVLMLLPAKSILKYFKKRLGKVKLFI